MTGLPQGWVLTNVGDLVQLKYGKALPERERSGFGNPVYGSNGVVGHHCDALVQEEAIVVGRKGSVGEVHHARGPCWPIDTTYYVDSFQGMPSRFWYYALRGLPLTRLNRSTAIPGLNREDAYGLVLALPPLAEQRRIADKLDDLLARVDACRDRLDRVPGILKRFRQAVLAAATSGELTRDWRGDESTATLPSGWGETTLGGLCEQGRVITYGVIKLGDETVDGVPCLRTSNVRWLKVDTDVVKKIAPALSAEYGRTVLRGGEVLVNVRGTLGGVAVVGPEMRGWNVSREVAVVPGDANRIFSEFLAYWIADERSQRWLAGVEKGVAYTGINIEDLRTLPVFLPSLEEQREISSRVKLLLALADKAELRHSGAEFLVRGLPSAILAKAFRGELVSHDTNDEPASVLLDRIRADCGDLATDKVRRVRKPRDVVGAEA